MKSLGGRTRLYGLLCAVSFILLISPNPAATVSVTIKNLYTIDHNQVSAQPFPATTGAPGLKPVSLSGFENQTIGNLFLSRGVVHGQRVTLYQFREVVQTGVVSIAGAVGSSSSVVFASFTPKSKDLHLGDGFIVNYSSSLEKQIQGLGKGIDRVAETYAKSRDPNVRLLGSYYRIVADSFERLGDSLPEQVQNLRVSGTSALLLDDYDSLACWAARLALAAATLAMFDACIPEPFAILACPAAVLAYAAAAIAVIIACPS